MLIGNIYIIVIRNRHIYLSQQNIHCVFNFTTLQHKNIIFVLK